MGENGDEKIPFGSFAEFWAALNRLYESQLADKEELKAMAEQQRAMAEQHRAMAEEHKATDDRLDRLASMVTTLAGTVTQLATVVGIARAPPGAHGRTVGRQA